MAYLLTLVRADRAVLQQNVDIARLRESQLIPGHAPSPSNGGRARGSHLRHDRPLPRSEASHGKEANWLAPGRASSLSCGSTCRVKQAVDYNPKPGDVERQK